MQFPTDYTEHVDALARAVGVACSARVPGPLVPGRYRITGRGQAAALGGLVVLEAWLVLKAHHAPAMFQPLIRHLRWLLRALAHWLAQARARGWRARISP